MIKPIEETTGDSQSLKFPVYTLSYPEKNSLDRLFHFRSNFKMKNSDRWCSDLGYGCTLNSCGELL